MSSFLLKPFLQKSLTFTARQQQRVSLPAVTSFSKNCSLQLRSSSHQDDSSSNNSTTQQKQDDRIFPVYMHHVSKIVLQHLQDSRSEWLVDQGLDRGLAVKSNGTFLLKFPARQGMDAGKIWTSYDASTRQHWLSVYRQQFNAKFLLKTGRCKVSGMEKMMEDAHKLMTKNNETVEDQIRHQVDQMVRRIPPPMKQVYHQKEAAAAEASNES